MTIKRVLKFILIIFILFILLTFFNKILNKCEENTGKVNKNVIIKQKREHNDNNFGYEYD